MCSSGFHGSETLPRSSQETLVHRTKAVGRPHEEERPVAKINLRAEARLFKTLFLIVRSIFLQYIYTHIYIYIYN